MSNISFATSSEFAKLRRFKLTIERLYDYFYTCEFSQVFNNLQPINNFHDATTPAQFGYLIFFLRVEFNRPLGYNIFDCCSYNQVIDLIIPDFEKLETKYMKERQETFFQLSKLSKSYIYRISNILTGQSYIGKTCKPPPSRWYQHFSKPGNSKFHKAIKNSPITHWTFTVIEEIIFPVHVYSDIEALKFIKEREKYWISQYDAIKDGYNSVY